MKRISAVPHSNTVFGDVLKLVPWAEFKRLVQTRTGKPFPQDPPEQLKLAVNAVFDSWFAKKANRPAGASTSIARPG